MWILGGYETKQKLQYLPFPEGIVYTIKRNHCLTTRVNAVFGYILTLSGLSGKKITGNISDDEDVSRLVARSGIEPETFGL
jgi:hypothetical protein